MAFRSDEVGSLTSTGTPLMSVKAISIQALSPKKFLILDSAGDLHLLHLSNSVIGSDASYHMKQLPHIMKAQKLAILPDVSLSMVPLFLFFFFFSNFVDSFMLECFIIKSLVIFNGNVI